MFGEVLTAGCAGSPPASGVPNTLLRQNAQPIQTMPPPAVPPSANAERHQLTVMFCDLAESTALATQLDPEDLREVVRAYQETAAAVIQHFEGHIAQYLGDGLLVHFGYPQAHEDDARRAVRTGLGIVETLAALNARLAQHPGVRLAVRIGIHTGLVVVGEMGGGSRQEQLALGETPNVAARLQGLAAQGQGAAGTAQMRQGLAAHQATGSERQRPYYLALLGEAYGSRGQTAEGLSLLAEALATVDRTGERGWEAELYRLQGEILLAQAGVRQQVQEAEACLHQALDVSCRQQAKSWELRAAISLSRLWQQQGKRAEAYTLLAPIYGWFTEGFDTADLQEAQALLEELEG